MRRVLKSATVAVTAIGALVAAGGVASAAPAPSGHQTLNLRAHSLTFAYNGPNPNKPTPGYSFSFTEALYPTNSHTRIGTDYVNCDIITTTRNLCTASWVLKNRGQISVAGSIPFNTKPGQRFTIPVTGGTGEFRDVRGTVTITGTSDSAYYTPQVFQLSR
jgi:hypothetical protein